jgi:hypothetical protein
LLGQRETPQDEAQAKRKTSHGCRNCCARIEAWPRISPVYSRACRRSADRALPLANRASEKARPILLPWHRGMHKPVSVRNVEFNFIRNVDRVKDHYPRALIRIVADDARERIATVIEVDGARQISRVTCRSTTLVRYCFSFRAPLFGHIAPTDAAGCLTIAFKI